MEKLKKYLAETEIDQKAFAAMVKTDPATLSRIIRGSHPPKLALAVAIEKATKGKVRCEDWL